MHYAVIMAAIYLNLSSLYVLHFLYIGQHTASCEQAKLSVEVGTLLLPANTVICYITARFLVRHFTRDVGLGAAISNPDRTVSPPMTVVGVNHFLGQSGNPDKWGGGIQRRSRKKAKSWGEEFGICLYTCRHIMKLLKMHSTN